MEVDAGEVVVVEFVDGKHGADVGVDGGRAEDDGGCRGDRKILGKIAWRSELRLEPEVEHST